MAKNVPRFECPDKDIERTYHFRWWTYRKHIRQIPTGWVVTEFLPKVSWSGPHNTIVCPAGHHFMEGRWLRNPEYLDSYARFWFSDEGETRRYGYSTWLAYAIDAMCRVHGDDKLTAELLDGFVKHFAFGDFKGFLTDKVVVQNLVEVFGQTAFALFRAYDGITADDLRPDVFKNVSLLSFFHKNNPTIPTTTDAVMPNTIIGPAMVNIFAQTP